MATVVLPRSLVALFPGLARRQDVIGGTVASVIDALDGASPGLRDRLVESGPRLRPHINVYVAGRPADLTTPVADGDTVHVIPAVSGGAVVGGPQGRRCGGRTLRARVGTAPATVRIVRPWLGDPG